MISFKTIADSQVSGGLRHRKINDNVYEFRADDDASSVTLRLGSEIMYIDHYTHIVTAGQIEQFIDIPGEEGVEIDIMVSNERLRISGLGTLILFS